MYDKLSHRSAITLLDANKADTYSRPLHCYACCKSFKIILMSQWLVIAWMVSQPTVSSRISSTEWQKIFLNFFVSPHPPALLDHLLPCNSPHPLSTTRRSTAFSHPARHLWNLVPQVVSKYWLSLDLQILSENTPFQIGVLCLILTRLVTLTVSFVLWIL